MHVLSLSLNNINLDNTNYDDADDPDAIIHTRILAWHMKFEKSKALKREFNKELIAEKVKWW